MKIFQFNFTSENWGVGFTISKSWNFGIDWCDIMIGSIWSESGEESNSWSMSFDAVFESIF